MGIFNGSNIDLNIKYFKFLSSSNLLLFTRSKYLTIVADKMILNKNIKQSNCIDRVRAAGLSFVQ